MLTETTQQSVATLSSRDDVVRWYAEQFVRVGQDNEPLSEYAERVGNDWHDKSMALDVKRAVRLLRTKI